MKGQNIIITRRQEKKKMERKGEDERTRQAQKRAEHTARQQEVDKEEGNRHEEG